MSTDWDATQNWVDFCRRVNPAAWYDANVDDFVKDYMSFIQDFESKEPRAIEFMVAFAIWKLKR